MHTIVQFWLIGDDFSPLPVQTCRAYGLALHTLQFRAQTTVAERPPSAGLGNAVKLLVMYLNKSCGTIVDAINLFEGMPEWKKSSDVCSVLEPVHAEAYVPAFVEDVLVLPHGSRYGTHCPGFLSMDGLYRAMEGSARGFR
jgi:hypothetical protein